MAEMQSIQSAMLWIGAGRTEEEQSFVYMDSQGFQGIGFVPREQSIERAEHIEPYLERLNKSASTEGILKEGWKKLSLKQIELPEEIQSNGLLF